MAQDLDILLDDDGDLAVENGDIVFVSGDDAVVQRLKVRLRHYQGEWYLDTTFGVPYYQEVLGKGKERAHVEAVLKDAIMATPGVAALKSFALESDNTTRGGRLTFSVLTVNGAEHLLQETL